MSVTPDPVPCVISLRVGQWGGRTLRKRRGLDDIGGIIVHEDTTLPLLIETIKVKLPAMFAWNEFVSPLTDIPLTLLVDKVPNET